MQPPPQVQVDPGASVQGGHITLDTQALTNHIDMTRIDILNEISAISGTPVPTILREQIESGSMTREQAGDIFREYMRDRYRRSMMASTSHTNSISRRELVTIQLVTPEDRHVPTISTLSHLYEMGVLSTNDMRRMMGYHGISLDTPLHVERIPLSERSLQVVGLDEAMEWESEAGGISMPIDDNNDVKPKVALEDLQCNHCLYKESKVIQDQYNGTGKQLVICSHLQRGTGRKWNNVPEDGKCKTFKSADRLLEEPSRWKRLHFKSG